MNSISKVMTSYRKNQVTGQFEKDCEVLYRVFEPERNDLLVFEREGVKRQVKIVQNNAYIYKFNKKSIGAIGGATGLYNFLKKELEEITGGCFGLVCKNIFNTSI